MHERPHGSTEENLEGEVFQAGSYRSLKLKVIRQA
jgi:hypothetical protein